MSNDRGAKLSTHAKKRLVERFGFSADTELMRKINFDYSLIDINTDGEEIRQVSHKGKYIQSIVVRTMNEVLTVKTFIPSTYVQQNNRDIIKRKLSPTQKMVKDICEYKKTINNLSISLQSKSDLIEEMKTERDNLFKSRFFNGFVKYMKLRKEYKKGVESERF